MRRFLWLFIACSLIGLAWAGRRQLRSPRHWKPMQLQLAPAAAWENISPEQRQGLAVLFKDCLEYAGGVPVVEQEAAMPQKDRELDSLELCAVRSGDRVRIRLRWNRAGQPEEIREGLAEPPGKAFASALAGLGLAAGAAKVMIPRNPEAFWSLAQMADWRQEQDLAKGMRGCAGLTGREPDCASIWLARARITSLWLLTSPVWDVDLQQQCEGDYVRALELAPHYPRAATSFARFKADMGNQHGALELLFAAIERFPQVPRLYETVAYAARTVGLLEGARLALRRRDQVLGPSRGEAGLTENTYLYLGELDTFEAILGPGSDLESDAVRDFYRGYARLLRGDRSGAEAFFARAHRDPNEVPQFARLAEVYQRGLRGEPEAALALLRRIWADRVPLRVPDGEYTFKLAEAFGFLGSLGEAQEVATRAFSQGFGCTRWYLESPFLAGLRGTPRWAALQQHLQDRQRFAQRIFPLARFRF